MTERARRESEFYELQSGLDRVYLIPSPTLLPNAKSAMAGKRSSSDRITKNSGGYRRKGVRNLGASLGGLSTNSMANASGNINSPNPQTPLPPFTAPAFPSFSYLGYPHGSPASFSNNHAQSMSAGQAESSVQAYFSMQQPSMPQASASGYQSLNTPMSNSSAVASTPTSAGLASSLQSIQFHHPVTHRPARILLDHEKILLEKFYFQKNRNGPKLTSRAMEEWRLRLSEHGLDEWNNFVLHKQSDAEAKMRLESVAAHDLYMIKIKGDEDKAARRKSRLEYFARKKKNDAQQGLRAGPSARKGKKSNKKESIVEDEWTDEEEDEEEEHNKDDEDDRGGDDGQDGESDRASGKNII